MLYPRIISISFASDSFNNDNSNKRTEIIGRTTDGFCPFFMLFNKPKTAIKLLQ